MNSFEEKLREVFFDGQHTIISKKRPCKEIRHLRQELRTIDDYLQSSGCFSSGHDFYARTKLKAKDVGTQTRFIKFDGGIFVLGQLRDYSLVFDDIIVIYAAYFGATPQDHCSQFIGVSPEKTIHIGLGRETGRYYTNITCKSGWLQLLYGEGHAFSCVAKHRTSAHPEVIRTYADYELSTISFEHTKQDEIQQLHIACEEWNGEKRQLIFAKGELRLQ